MRLKCKKTNRISPANAGDLAALVTLTLATGFACQLQYMYSDEKVTVGTAQPYSLSKNY